MKARSGVAVRSGDSGESGTAFLEAEHKEWCRDEDAVLVELQDEVANGDLTEAQLEAVEEFVDLVRERRAKFIAGIAGRKARIAGVRK